MEHTEIMTEKKKLDIIGASGPFQRIWHFPPENRNGSVVPTWPASNEKLLSV